MSEKTRIFCSIMVILTIFIVLISECQAHNDCPFDCGVPYRLSTDGLYYPDPPPVGVIVYGQQVFFNCNCREIIVIHEYDSRYNDDREHFRLHQEYVNRYRNR